MPESLEAVKAPAEAKEGSGWAATGTRRPQIETRADTAALAHIVAAR